MQNLLKQLPRVANQGFLCPTQNPSIFKERVAALLNGEARGNLSTYFYGSPQSANDAVNGYGLFRDLCKHTDYYLYRSETSLIQSVSTDLAGIFGAGATYIELGPGAKQSVALKTLPVLQAVEDPKAYVAVDYNSISSVQAAETVLHKIPQIRAEVVTEDFTTLIGLGDRYRNPVFLMFGNTLGNIEGAPNVFNPNIIEYLQKIKNVIGKNSSLLIAYDCNQNHDMVQAAYNNPVAKAWIHNIIFRLQRDAFMQIDPAGFESYADFNANNYCVEIGLRSLQNQTVAMDGQSWTIAAGQELHVYNSYKFTPKVLKQLLLRAGLVSSHLLTNSQATTALELVEQA